MGKKKRTNNYLQNTIQKN